MRSSRHLDLGLGLGLINRNTASLNNEGVSCIGFKLLNLVLGLNNR